jgi:hypothetical protein
MKDGVVIIKVVGIPVFAHGQLYVAISRATDCRQIYISPLMDIVYSEVFPAGNVNHGRCEGGGSANLLAISIYYHKNQKHLTM